MRCARMPGAGSLKTPMGLNNPSRIMSDSKLNNQVDDIVVGLKLGLSGLAAVYLHGSAVKTGLRADSDIDLALLFEHGKNPDAKKLFTVRSELEEAVGRSVDLGVLSTENPVFAKEVITSGKRLMCTDATFCQYFEMYVLSFYAKLNDERRQVLNSYRIQDSF